jgi:hypothetical protein
MTFGVDRISRTISLSALFRRQQELRRGTFVLPDKGRRVLAVTLASALLPFLETPWLQFSFSHSMIHFVVPRENGTLPDITKPFLALDHIPINSDDTVSTEDSSGTTRHMIHPNASVLALGIILYELHYCSPLELIAGKPHGTRNLNEDYYTCIDNLQAFEAEAGVDYCRATKACLTGQYYPPGQDADFEDVSVQRLFHQNVVKPLEDVIYKMWGLQMQDLASFNLERNESCWGSIGRDVVRIHTDVDNSPHAHDTAISGAHDSMTKAASVRHTVPRSDIMPPMSAQHSSGSQTYKHFSKVSEKSLYFFDASQQISSEQE